MRLAAAFLVVALAACSGPMPERGGRPNGADPAGTPPPADLTANQFDQLRALGTPVLVPEISDAYELAVFEVNQSPTASQYRLTYERPDGACFEVSGSTEGLGGPEFPLVSTEARLRNVPGEPSVRIYQAADDPLATSAQVWGLGTVVSETVPVGRMNVLFLSDTVGGCRPVTLEEGTQIVTELRMISADGTVVSPPAPSIGLGTFAPADDVLDRYNSGSAPEVAARSVADRFETDNVAVDVLSQDDKEAVVLVTALGLFDDSVRDERLRLVYRDSGVGTWELVGAGRQVRCQPGRGHDGWSADACR